MPLKWCMHVCCTHNVQINSKTSKLCNLHCQRVLLQMWVGVTGAGLSRDGSQSSNIAYILFHGSASKCMYGLWQTTWLAAVSRTTLRVDMQLNLLPFFGHSTKTMFQMAFRNMHKICKIVINCYFHQQTKCTVNDAKYAPTTWLLRNCASSGPVHNNFCRKESSIYYKMTKYQWNRRGLIGKTYKRTLKFSTHITPQYQSLSKIQHFITLDNKMWQNVSQQIRNTVITHNSHKKDKAF